MRIEKDSLGELRIPEDALYGVQTLRARKNFPISGTQVHPQLIKSYLLLKKAAAIANHAAGALDSRRKQAISRAIGELLDSDFRGHFIVDAYQAGAGTSQNMNCNEVIANRANQLLGKPLGSYDPIHPNDHVNMSQSTNDTYPTALRLSALALSRALAAELEDFSKSLAKKARQFDGVLKAGRTHLQDAVPIRLGQEFAAYQATVLELLKLLAQGQEALSELGIGGSAVGTGVNVPRGYRARCLSELRKLCKEPKLRPARDLRAAMQSQLPVVIYSNALRAIALELTRIFNDLRLLSSGPLTGLAELRLPSTQPGSSIMPGKVNPSMLEMGNQVLFKVLGNDVTVGLAAQAGQLELNVMMPVMAQAVLESSELLTQMLKNVRIKCIDGIQANIPRCREYAEKTPAIATALNTVLGYAKAAEITKQALEEGITVTQLVQREKLLSGAEIKRLLDPRKLT